MSTPDPNNDILLQARRFLSQQEELYGEIILDRRTVVPAVAVPETRAAGVARTGAAARDLFGTPGSIPGSITGGTSTPPGTFNLPDEPWTSSRDLTELNGAICDCLKCGLGHTRTKFVFGTGNPAADVMFIGEGPGADEDAQGEPFVGRAGQLLNKIIEATGFKRADVYICNIVKCRPPNNRAPLPEESEQCTPYLMKQIELVDPEFIICLGRTAAQWLLKTGDGLSALRGRIHDFHGRKLIVTYHPAALLRNPGWKAPTWEDMKMFMKAMDASNNSKPKGPKNDS